MFGSAITPRALAMLIATVISGLVAMGFLIFCSLAMPEWEFWWVIVMFTFVFAVSGFLIFASIKRFIQSRVDLIHRTVHELQTGKDQVFELNMSDDVLGQIGDDVQLWAEKKQQEIKGLKEREKFRREFIGNLAHELKTPITSIQGYILTLLEGGLEDENVNRDFLERASKGVDRLTSIVDDMDTITRLEGGILELDLEPVDLHGLADEVVSDIRLRAKKAKVSIINQVPSDTQVICDASRIMQVFTNLLNNAINYGKEGGKVIISCFHLGDRVMIEVVDDGIGIDAEHLPRLFERFYRVGSSRSRHEGGSGLGLAIVKHILEAHGQSITVVSEPDRGTRFTFSLKKR